MVLDNGDYWVTEGFQDEIVEDIFTGVPEIMVVIPEGNAKTTLLGGVNLYTTDFKATANCLVAAASREQAEILFGQAAGLVYRSPGFDRRFRVFEGYRRIVAYRSRGKMQVKAADDRTGDGAIFDLATIDEPHRARDLSLWRTWRGKVDKRGGQILGISTAGVPGSDFEETRDAMHRTATESHTEGRHTRSASRDALIHDWRLRSSDDPNDMELVKLANPLSTITVDSLTRKRRSPSMTPAHWARFVCNVATQLSGPGISGEVWDGLEEEELTIPSGIPRVGFLDLGWKIDTTGMGVIAWESAERRLVTGCKKFAPSPGEPVDESDVVAGILDIQEAFGVEEFVYDPNAGGQQMVQMLEKGTHPLQVARGLPPLLFIEHSQSNAAMALAAVRMDEAIRNAWLVHDGDRDLRQAALNVVERQVGGERWVYDRPSDARGARRSRWPIDLFTGLLFGNSYLVGEHDKPKKEVLVAWA